MRWRNPASAAAPRRLRRWPLPAPATCGTGGRDSTLAAPVPVAAPPIPRRWSVRRRRSPRRTRAHGRAHAARPAHRRAPKLAPNHRCSRPSGRRRRRKKRRRLSSIANLVAASPHRPAVHRDARRAQGSARPPASPRGRSTVRPMHRCCRPARCRRVVSPIAPSDRPELARVDAELLDQLLNNSGEASIARARLEQQIGSIDFNVGELSRTVTRLKEQLRKLELETEAQILHRYEEEKGTRGEFDPLELDRYSSIQQFSRALAETANDVGSIQQLLETLTKDTQNLLTQQARTITELQNGLMRTRMVPVPAPRAAPGAHRAPGGHRHAQEGRACHRGRLRRARSPGARAHDAAVRAHAAQRRRARHRNARGAQEEGQERDPARSPSRLHREGSEVVVEVSDDGAGMNLKAIRDKGISLGHGARRSAAVRRRHHPAHPRARLLDRGRR